MRAIERVDQTSNGLTTNFGNHTIGKSAELVRRTAIFHGLTAKDAKYAKDAKGAQERAK
jgi:hypothetical protein